MVSMLRTWKLSLLTKESVLLWRSRMWNEFFFLCLRILPLRLLGSYNSN